MTYLNFLNKIIRLDVVDSTNNFASRLIREESPQEGTVILAEYQKSGRGQKEHNWTSEKGKNLTFSIILYPTMLKVERQFYLSMAISVSIVRCLQTLISNVSIKWPNDIFIQNRKIAGILIENSIKGSFLQNSIIGIGLNVNQLNFSDVPEATSLAIELNKQLNKDIILTNLMQYISSWLSKLYNNNYNSIKNIYESLLFCKDQNAAFIKDNKKFSGIITGVSEFGQLSIKHENGLVNHYNFNEVSFSKD